MFVFAKASSRTRLPPHHADFWSRSFAADSELSMQWALSEELRR